MAKIIYFFSSKFLKALVIIWNVLQRNNHPNQVDVKKEEILVSYLAAVSQFPTDLFESLQHISEHDSPETPDTNDTHYFNRMSQCFRMDFEGMLDCC